MAIEIKELHIRVRISENEQEERKTAGINLQHIAELEQRMVEACVKKVLEKIKEKEER